MRVQDEAIRGLVVLAATGRDLLTECDRWCGGLRAYGGILEWDR